MNSINDYLYIGSASDAWNVQDNIDAVVNVMYDHPCSENMKGRKHFWYPMHDGPGNDVYYIDAVVNTINNLQKCGLRTLVHCYLGRSRSVAMVSCYLTRYCNFELDDAYGFVKASRPIAEINTGLLKSCREYVSQFR